MYLPVHPFLGDYKYIIGCTWDVCDCGNPPSYSLQVSALPESVREHLASLPDVHDMVLGHLEHVPEWRAHIELHAPTFLQEYDGKDRIEKCVLL